MDRSEWDDTDGEPDPFPPAPVPPHERSWRHPSELGVARTAAVELTPNTGPGRALVGVSVAMGMLLVAGLVHLLTPRAGGGTAVVAASSNPPIPQVTSVSVVPVSSAPLFPSVPTTAPATSGPAPVPSSTSAPSTTTSGVTLVTAAPVDVELSVASFTSSSSRPSKAVALGDDSMFVTTAAAIGDAASVEVTFDDGSVLLAEVLVVDDRLGVAVLQVDRPLAAPLPGLGEVSPGQPVTVLDDEPQAATVGEDHGLAVEAGVETAEGAPVIDDDGQLVGLCTRDRDGALRVVPAAVLDQIVTATRHVLATTPWLGITGQRAPGGGVEVQTVAPASPAEAAGLAVGDTITSVDDRPVRSVPELVLELARHQPGDVVRVVVTRPIAADPSAASSPAVVPTWAPVRHELWVTLAARPSA